MLEDRRRLTGSVYFRGLVDDAIANQHVHASEFAAKYLADLLTSRIARRKDDHQAQQPLAILLAHALNAGGTVQQVKLAYLGNEALFIAGFFSDSLRRKLVDVDYYAAIGRVAYQVLGDLVGGGGPNVFVELGFGFISFVDVLTEVSERTLCSSDSDLLRLYEKWILTDSERLRKLLKEKGIVANASYRNTRVQ